MMSFLAMLIYGDRGVMVERMVAFVSCGKLRVMSNA